MRAGKVKLYCLKPRYACIIIEKDSGSGFVMLDKDVCTDFVDNLLIPVADKSAI